MLVRTCGTAQKKFANETWKEFTEMEIGFPANDAHRKSISPWVSLEIFSLSIGSKIIFESQLGKKKCIAFAQRTPISPSQEWMSWAPVELVVSLFPHWPSFEGASRTQKEDLPGQNRARSKFFRRRCKGVRCDSSAPDNGCVREAGTGCVAMYEAQS